MARKLIKKQIRTRFCCCIELDCRFISSDLPCPNGRLPNGNANPIGKFLWSTGFVDAETGEEVSITSDDIILGEVEEPKEVIEVVDD